MKYISILTLIFTAIYVQSQTFADDVASIMFEKCSPCHHSGGIGPFPLMSYSDAFPLAAMISTNVSQKTMPPWPPNDSYSEFSHPRSLTNSQIQTIVDWVNNGAPEGNPANTPAPPVFNNSSILGPADLSLRIPDYISKATSGNDDYVCFSIPSGLTSTQTVQAIEVIPGNASIVHHVLAYIDPNGTYSTDTTSHNCAGPSSQSIPLVAGYAPGSRPDQFPNSTNLKLGVEIPANANIILAMHYPEGSQGILDSTRINFHFYPQGTQGVRIMNAAPILNDLSFTINANTVDSVEAYFPGPTTPVPVDFTLFSIFPHAHLIGKNFIVYAVNQFPPFDQIPLIHIPEWDFDWQGFYVFKYMKKLPTGYKLYGKCVYDNTVNNPFNPNSPPQNISFGLNTTDEMFLVYFQYMFYQNGDENYNIDSLLNLQTPTGVEPLSVIDNGLFVTSYPNPSAGDAVIHLYSEKNQSASLQLYNLQGQLIRTFFERKRLSGEEKLFWNGSDNQGNEVPPGVYLIQLETEKGLKFTHKMIHSNQ